MYRNWVWEHGATRKPDFECKIHCHQEATQVAPEDEYSSQKCNIKIKSC